MAPFIRLGQLGFLDSGWAAKGHERAILGAKAESSRRVDAGRYLPNCEMAPVTPIPAID
jgi:hypothetical protein